ncbi:hypothetical protein AGR7B_pAt0100 [Agrobacterium deltaense RV3]|nr:hypothetical protein AGR7B_pAt0100 [Agrobacterium deltaense RV3]
MAGVSLPLGDPSNDFFESIRPDRFIAVMIGGFDPVPSVKKGWARPLAGRGSTHARRGAPGARTRSPRIRVTILSRYNTDQ